MKQPDLSVIILSYNTKDLTLSCLRALLDSNLGKFTMEVILVDNASDDKTVQEVKAVFPAVTCIVNPTNIGFAKGNNIGIRQSKGRYMLLLNSDTEVDKDALHTILRFMEDHPRAGVATAKLVLRDGTMDPACHRGFPTPWAAFTYFTKLEALFPRTTLFGMYHMGYKNMTVPHQVDAVSGAFFMVRKEVADDVGLLDEDFFMYGEDLDWAYRIRERGWELWFDPDATVLHHKKQSGRSHADKQRRLKNQEHFLSTMQLFYKKHYEEKYGAVVTNLVYFGIWLKLFFLKIFSI